MGNRMLSDEILLALIKKNSGGGQSAIHVKGVTTTALTDGCNTNPITINGESYTAVDGDLVAYQSKEFLFNGTIWQELGDVSEVMAIIEKILDDIADEFDATTTYAVDDFVVKDSVLYKCISAHTGAWAAADFTATSLSNEIKNNKGTVYTAGKYIDINANNEISVNPVVPNEAFSYTFKQIDDNSVEIIKTVDDVVVFDEVYSCWDPAAQQSIEVNETLDNAINIHVYTGGERSYTLLIASDAHEAGFKQTTPWWERNTFVETFSTVDHSGEKLITKSELDSALADKQSVLTAGDHISIDAQNSISVNRDLVPHQTSYRIKGTGRDTMNITKYIDGVQESSTDYVYSQGTTRTIDDAFTINDTYSSDGYIWQFVWLKDSTTHDKDYTVEYRSYEGAFDFTEVFNDEDLSGYKLVIKSELDAALAGKQGTLTAGNYIDITSGEISVDRVIPNASFTYNFKILEQHTVHVTKTVNGSVVFEQDYTDATASTPIIFDDAISFRADGYWYFEYELLIDSESHSAGFKQRWSSLEYVGYTENFTSVDNTGKKLIIKSEMDTALATKADLTDLAPAFSSSTAYTVGQYVSYDGNIYKCTSAHSAGAWAAGDFTLVAVGSELESKQNATDNSLQTTDKTVVGAVNELKSGLIDVNSNIANLNGETGSIFGNSNIQITINSGDLLWLFTYRDNTQYISVYIVGGTWNGTPSVVKIVETENITVEGVAGTPPYNIVKITNANSGYINYKIVKIASFV